MTEADGACGSWQPDEATGLVVNGPETITFRRLLPGDYAVYVNAYGRDEQEDLESEEGVVHYFTETPFHVDVWLGNSKSVTTLVDTVTHAQAGGKWFSAGTVRSREVSHRGLCAGALDRLQEFAGLGERLLCYTWERAASAGGAVVPYPLNGAARRALEGAAARRVARRGRAKSAPARRAGAGAGGRAVRADPPAAAAAAAAEAGQH